MPFHEFTYVIMTTPVDTLSVDGSVACLLMRCMDDVQFYIRESPSSILGTILRYT